MTDTDKLEEIRERDTAIFDGANWLKMPNQYEMDRRFLLSLIEQLQAENERLKRGGSFDVWMEKRAQHEDTP